MTDQHAPADRLVELDLARDMVPDHPTVTPDGERLAARIDGVELRRATVHPDERGSLTEIYDPAWGFAPGPLVYVYTGSVRPGQRKGWVVHRLQDDRLFFDNGTAKVVLYDARAGSPTHGMVNELFLGTQSPGLVVIPAGVVHAVANVGLEDLRFVNLPTRPYDHANPDKERLPADTDAIPYEL